MTTDNLAIWRQLERTDPDQTKPFQRPGGFRGTAIKPLYAVKKMTEVFGPCGKGWGTTEPQFRVEGDAVFCTVGLWTITASNPEAYIWGVGGDIIVKRPRSGEPYTDDEAFKKAYTDALTNAMKHLGMSADVHMGLFDDSKYVAEARKCSAQGAPPPPERPHDPAAPAPEATAAAGNARDWTRTEAEARGKEIASSLRDHGGSAMNLEAAWSMYADEIMSMPAAAQRGLRKVYVTEMAAMTREAAQQELLA